MALSVSTRDLREHLQHVLSGTYTIERELGGGGMSRVFLASDPALGRQVVIKVPVREAGLELSAERFAREVRLAARLNHPNIVPVLAAGEADGIAWYTMPFVTGQSLRHRLTVARPLALREAISVLTDVARALEFAHAQGVVHRDVKPENVLLAGSAATVTDFGIAKAISASRTAGGAPGQGDATLTRLGSAVGTPAYMAPEQALGDPATDHRADLYAWGCLAYELLTGAAPFAGESHRVLAAHVSGMPSPIADRRPDVPSGLARLVMQCLAKDPDRRPQSASEVLAALGGDLSDVESLPSTQTPAGSLSGRASKAGRALLGTALALGLAAVVWAVTNRGSTSRSTTNQAALEDSVPSVAVLAIRVVPDSGNNAYLGEGMADEITVALQRLPGLRVASRATVGTWAARGVAPDSIARGLRVRTFLTGTIGRVGDRFRVTAELTDAATGTAKWADRYDQESRDIFALQEEIARRIVAGLQVHLAGAPPTAPRGTADLAAYDLYLQGRAAFQQRGRDGVSNAIRLFERATRRDPKFARAWGALALVWSQAPGWLFVSVDSVVGPTRRAAARALANDSTLGEPDAALGYLAFYQWDWARAEQLLRQAIVKDPQSAAAPLWLGELLTTLGRTSEGVAQSHRAWELEPLNSTALATYAYALLADGRVLNAVAAAEQARELDRTNPLVPFVLSAAQVAAGQFGAAERVMARAVGPGAGMDVFRAYLASMRGDRTAAERLRRDLPPNALSEAPFFKFYLHAALGDTAGALGVIEEAVASRSVMFIRIKPAAPVFDPYRRHARFQAALAHAGLDTTLFRPRTLGAVGRPP